MKEAATKQIVPEHIKIKVAEIAKQIQAIVVEIEIINVLDPEGAQYLISALFAAAKDAKESIED